MKCSQVNLFWGTWGLQSAAFLHPQADTSAWSSWSNQCLLIHPYCKDLRIPVSQGIHFWLTLIPCMKWDGLLLWTLFLPLYSASYPSNICEFTQWKSLDSHCSDIIPWRQKWVLPNFPNKAVCFWGVNEGSDSWRYPSGTQVLCFCVRDCQAVIHCAGKRTKQSQTKCLT